MWLGPQTLPFCPCLADSHTGHGGGESSQSSPRHPCSLQPALWLHRPTPPPCNLAPWEPDSSPSSFSFRFVPSCVQHALEDAKLSEAPSPSLRSTGCTRSLHSTALHTKEAEPPTSCFGVLPGSFSLKQATLSELASHPSPKIPGSRGPADGIFWCHIPRVSSNGQRRLEVERQRRHS